MKSIRVLYTFVFFEQIKEVAFDQIGREYKKTGSCDLSVLRDTFMNFLGSMALAKGSPFTDNISKEYINVFSKNHAQNIQKVNWLRFDIRLMKMEAAGMFGLWWRRATTDPRRCMDEARARPITPRLKLKGLSGAFTVLGVGIILSLIAFFGERITFGRQKMTVKFDPNLHHMQD